MKCSKIHATCRYIYVWKLFLFSANLFLFITGYWVSLIIWAGSQPDLPRKFISNNRTIKSKRILILIFIFFLQLLLSFLHLL